jgi:hypothetical protein
LAASERGQARSNGHRAVPPEDDGAALNRLASWTKNRTELNKFLVDNPTRLYQF